MTNIDIENINLRETYENAYTMRCVGGGISTSIPKKIVERKAKELGISVQEFIKDYEIVMMYNSFKVVDGVFIFRKKEGNGR
jgi:DMSO/TMAO reductase YedYZ molybdopterin-dependent catalytic subunit